MLQIFAGAVTLVALGALIYFARPGTRSKSAMAIFGVISLASLFLTMTDPTRNMELAIEAFGVEVTYRTETPERVDAVMRSEGEQEHAVTEVSALAAAEASAELVEVSQARSDADRTDADFLVLSTLAWREGENAQALRYAETGLARPASDPGITAALHSRMGAVVEELDPASAEEHYRTAIAIDPAFPYSHNNLGNLLAAGGQTGEAETAYRDAIRLDPDHPAAHNNLGILLAETDRAEEAEAAYRTAIELEPEFAVALSNLGVLLSERGRSLEAERTFERAIELEPLNPAPRNNLEFLRQNNSIRVNPDATTGEMNLRNSGID